MSEHARMNRSFSGGRLAFADLAVIERVWVAMLDKFEDQCFTQDDLMENNDF